MSLSRSLLAVALVAMVGILGYRVVAAGPGSEAQDPPEDPVERLAAAPLDGAAFGELAIASQAGGNAAATRKLHEIAVRRDPRNLHVRAWLADQYLRAGDYPEALEHLDVVLRLSPAARKNLPPSMVEWASDPAFAEALVATLGTRPSWRRDMDKALRAAVQQPGAGAVFAGLNASGDLNHKEVARWLDALMRAGSWGLAYSHWASALHLAPGEPLPMLYNGGFERPATQRGFDWRTERRSGTYTEFAPTEGANGNAAHLVFHGRPVSLANLEQALALPPGRYRISMRVKAIGLRTDQGLRWTLACQGRSGPLATGERLDGSFGWRETSLEFEIPAGDCAGQWLRLVNPAPRGSTQIVSGELWVDDMAVRPLASLSPGH